MIASAELKGVRGFQRTLDNQVRSEDGHSTDTDTSLGGSIGSSEAGEDDGRGATKGTEERLYSMYISYLNGYI